MATTMARSTRLAGLLLLGMACGGDEAEPPERSELPLALRGEAASFVRIGLKPAAIAPGESAVLSWRARGLERVFVIRDDDGPTIELVGADARRGRRRVTASRTTTFTFVGATPLGRLVTERADGSPAAAALTVKF